MPSRYSFTEYSNEWPLRFEAEAERLRELLGEAIVAIYHIGSTSVPGLAAKPIIDLLPVARVISDVDALAGSFRSAGYRAWGEYGLGGRRYFTKDRAGFRTHNIHIYGVDHPDIERHLALCAYLRANAEVCLEYQSLKQAAYARHPADIEAYNDCKNGWIKRTERTALEWYRGANIA